MADIVTASTVAIVCGMRYWPVVRSLNTTETAYMPAFWRVTDDTVTGSLGMGYTIADQK